MNSPDEVEERLSEALADQLPGPWAARAVSILTPVVTGVAPARPVAAPAVLPDGTGPSYEAIRAGAERRLGRATDAGCQTWADVLRACLYAALTEEDTNALRAKVSAIAEACGAWINDLDRRLGT